MNSNYTSEKSDILRLAERLANSFSYRISSFANRRRARREYDLYLQSGKQPFAPGYFDTAMIHDMIDALRPSESSVVYYRYAATGWKISTEAACRNCEYTTPARWDVGPFSKAADNQNPTPVASGIPAAAGAVVCLDLLK